MKHTQVFVCVLALLWESLHLGYNTIFTAQRILQEIVNQNIISENKRGRVFSLCGFQLQTVKTSH